VVAVPASTLSAKTRTSATFLYDLLGASKQHRPHVEAERFGT